MQRAPGRGRSITIPDELLAAICVHARAAFPAECCGYLTGTADGDAVDAVVPCRNAQGDATAVTTTDRTAETGFALAPADLIAFARSFDGERPARVFYHSHTNGRAYFSELDHRIATSPAGGPSYPIQHLVIGVTDAAITEVAQFAWSESAGTFVELARWQP